MFFDKLGQKGLGSKTQLNIYQLLHAMLEVAPEHDLITANPVRQKLHRPKWNYTKLPIWTLEQV